MSVDIKLKQVQLQLLQENGFLIPDEECNIIIPYSPSGYEDYSNLGHVSGQYEIDNFLTYKRLYTGNDAFTITWKGSTSIAKNLNDNGQIQINWNLGEYILGFNEGVSSDVGFENDASFSEYKKHNVSNTLTFRIRADNYDLNENYKYLFYKVPEISKDILYRVVSLETEYVGRVKVCYVLTLQSLQQELENTGKAKSQNVMPNAPGQGYYDPLIVENPKEEDYVDNINWKKIDKTRWLTIDKQKIWNNPCKKVILKMFGFGMLMNFTMVGRKVYANQAFSDYGIPRLIFPMNFTQASTPTLYRAQQAEDNFYYAYSLFPTIAFNKDIFNAIKDFTEVNKVWTNQGIMYINSGDIKTTNQIENEQYKYSLFGKITLVGGNEVYLPWTPTLDKRYVVDTRGTYGTKTSYSITEGARAIHNRLWDSYWVNKQLSRLPIRKENTLTFGSVIGTGLFGLLSGKKTGVIAGSILFTIGLLGTLLTQVPNKTLEFGLSGLLPCAITDFMLNEASVSLPNLIAGKQYFKLNYFLNDDDQDFITFFNTQSLNTSFQAELTDLFTKDAINIYETTLIGQTKREDGTNIFNDGSQLLVGGGEELRAIDNTQVGFIIDSFNLQALFKGDFSVEFLDKDDNVIWSGVYQSEAKWTNSLREINTWRNTSIYGRENIFLEEPKPWPEQIELAPWGQPTYNISLNSSMVPIVVSSPLGTGWDISRLAQEYDGLIEDNFNNTQGPGFKVFGKTYNSGGKPWMKFHHSQERLQQRKVKDRILPTYGLITKEAFFQTYKNIKIKINCLNQTSEEEIFTPSSSTEVTKTFLFSRTDKFNSACIYANDPADVGVVLSIQDFRSDIVGGSYANAWHIRSLKNIVNYVSAVEIKFKLTFENDGVYVEQIPLQKTIRIEYDYVEMGKQYESGTPPVSNDNLVANLWSKRHCGFGRNKEIVNLRQNFFGKYNVVSSSGDNYQFVDSFSIGQILSEKK